MKTKEPYQQRTERDLRERIKELNCLYGLSRIIESRRDRLGPLLAEAAELLPPAVQFPEVACARISVGRDSYTTGRFRESEWELNAAIAVEGETFGAVQLFYRQRAWPPGEPPFIPEERSLLDAFAKRLAHHIEHVRAVAALAESEKRYRIAFENSPAPLWEEDFSEVGKTLHELRRTGVEDVAAYLDAHPEAVSQWVRKIRVLDVNRAAVALHQAGGKAELMGSLDRLFSKASLPGLKKELAAIAEGKTDFETQVTEQTVDGRPRELIVRWSVLPGHEVSLDRVYVSATDVTELNRVKNELEESEEKYRTLIENASEAVLVVQDETVRFANPAAERLYGRSASEINGIPLASLIQPEDRPWVLDRHRRRQAGENPPGRYSFRMVCARNEVRWVDISAARIRWNGKPAVLALIQDITDRRETVEALRESEQRLATMVENLFDALVLVDADGIIRYVNRSALALFDREEDALLGNPFGFPITEQESFDMEILRPDGELRHAETRATSVIWKGEHSYLASIRDVTEQRAAREERARMGAHLEQIQRIEAIGTLAGGIAHDFNNILSPILGFTEIALEKVHGDVFLEESLDQVLQAGRRAKDLVRQILTFSRQAETEHLPFLPQPIVKEVMKMLRSTLPSTIEIRQHLNSERVLMGEATKVHQILMNLCTNAKHAMEEKGGVLTVSLEDVDLGDAEAARHLEPEPGPYVRLRVEDTGHGMEESTLAKIFEPYYTTKGEEKGTGLGLSVVHGIVKNHRGHIDADSEVGRGSVFTVYLPAVSRGEKPREEKDSTPAGGDEHILFVDDEPTMVKLYRNLLQSFGYRVTARTNGIEALELFKSKPETFDMILTDMTMPGMTGDELARECRRLRPEVPVILTTGFSEKIDEQRAERLGIAALLYKPVAKPDLGRTVRRVLDQSREGGL